MKTVRTIVLSCAVLAGSGCAVTDAGEARRGLIERGDYLSRPEVREFIDTLVARYDFERDELHAIFAQVERQERVLELIQAPAEGKPWHKYRPIFLTPPRIHGGIEFWRAHESLLARAEEQYGVPAEIIVAILGVETYYGDQAGGFPVLDALVTLGFDYPARGAFFREELEEFLLLAQEESLDHLGTEGSYAGAMGKGQFIASSYREYAVDFNEDGTRDLLNSTADAVGSVANYLSRHGWQRDEPIAMPARLQGETPRALRDEGLKPSITPETLERHGVEVRGELKNRKAALLEFELEGSYEYWAGFDNFYVITRYNRSPLYAMAVYQLSREIAQERARRLAGH